MRSCAGVHFHADVCVAFVGLVLPDSHTGGMRDGDTSKRLLCFKHLTALPLPACPASP
jgi:hypothetical protein